MAGTRWDRTIWYSGLLQLKAEGAAVPGGDPATALPKAGLEGGGEALVIIEAADGDGEEEADDDDSATEDTDAEVILIHLVSLSTGLGGWPPVWSGGPP